MLSHCIYFWSSIANDRGADVINEFQSSIAMFL